MRHLLLDLILLAVFFLLGIITHALWVEPVFVPPDLDLVHTTITRKLINYEKRIVGLEKEVKKCATSH